MVRLGDRLHELTSRVQAAADRLNLNQLPEENKVGKQELAGGSAVASFQAAIETFDSVCRRLEVIAQRLDETV